MEAVKKEKVGLAALPSHESDEGVTECHRCDVDVSIFMKTRTT